MFSWSLYKPLLHLKSFFMLFTVSKMLNTSCGTILIRDKCQQKWVYILNTEAILEYFYLLIVCACEYMRGTFVPWQRATLWHQFSPSTLHGFQGSNSGLQICKPNAFTYWANLLTSISEYLELYLSEPVELLDTKG